MYRTKYLKGVAVLVLGLAGSVFAQSGAQTPGTTGSTAATNAAADMTCCPQMPTGTIAGNSAASAPSVSTREEGGAKVKEEKARAKEDFNKNPYWEPRDWTYIYNQGP
jgi:hypothetical protein